jgi:hypothetical protein
MARSMCALIAVILPACADSRTGAGAPVGRCGADASGPGGRTAQLCRGGVDGAPLPQQPLVAATMYPFWRRDGPSAPPVRAEGWLDPRFPEYINATLDMFRASLNATAVRVTDFLAAAAGPLDPAVWSNVHAAVAAACDRGLAVILDLSTYRNFLQRTQPGVLPYNASLWAAFLDAVVPGFAAAPCLLNWAIAGEPAAPNFGNSSDPTRPTTSQLTQFYNDTSTRIALHDGAHLISPGGFLFMGFSPTESGIDWPTIFTLPHVHMAAMHSYSDSDRQAMPTLAAFAAAAGIPWQVEEFGFQQGAQSWCGHNTTGDAGRGAAIADTFQRATNVTAGGGGTGGDCGGTAGRGGRAANAPAAPPAPAALVGIWNGGDEVADGSFDVGGTPATALAAQAVRARGEL